LNPAIDQKAPICKQEAFLLKDAQTRQSYALEHKKTVALYYKGQRAFEDILDVISKNLDKL